MQLTRPSKSMLIVAGYIVGILVILAIFFFVAKLA